MPLTLPFSRISKHDTSTAGGKGASLGEMTQAGIPVPPGFVVLSTAFNRFLEETDLSAEIDSILHEVNHQEMHTVEHASEKIQKLILEAKMPKDIAEEIKKECKKLNTPYVAVRSSATAEDSSSAAWAGQLESYLNTTEKTLLQNVQKCWASLFTPRAIFYRFERGLHAQTISVAVVIQKMVQSEKSGIAFSVHPVTEDRNQLIIEAGFGLGESIVSGQITPDSYVVEKEPRRIIDKNIETQPKGLYRAHNGGNEWRDISKDQGERQVLSDEEILELSELVLKIENHYSFPCDIEWAYEKGKLYIVQSRPVTTLTKIKPNLNKNPIRELLGQHNKWDYVGRWEQPVLSSSLFLGWHKSKLIQDTFPGLQLGGEFRIAHCAFNPKEDKEKIFKELITLYKKKKLGSLVRKLNDRDRAINQEHKKFLVVKDKNNSKTVEKMLMSHTEYHFHWTFIAASVGILVLRLAKEVKFIKTDAELFEKAHPYLRKTWIEEEQEEMIGIAKILDKKVSKKASKNIIRKVIKKDRDLVTRIDAYVKKYAWVGTDKWFGSATTHEKAEARLMEELANVRAGNYLESHRSEADFYSLDPIIQLGVLCAYTRANCAGLIAQIEYAYKDIFKNIAEANGRTYKDLVNLTHQELISFFHAPSEFVFDEKKIERQKEYLIFFSHDNKIEVRVPSDPSYADVKAEYGEIESKNLYGKTASSFSGIGASPGKIIGKARVVFSRDQFTDFLDGEILVAPETTPAFVPLMRKAGAIVTDIGGITSHAAIVSREMKKPCIIGTKIATQVLHDGDLVEVDAEKGVVRVLKRAGAEG